MLAEQNFPRTELFPDCSSRAVSPQTAERNGAHEVDLWEARAEKCVIVFEHLQDKVASLNSSLRDKDMLNGVIVSRQAELQEELYVARENLAEAQEQARQDKMIEDEKVRKLLELKDTKFQWKAVAVLFVALVVAALFPVNVAQSGNKAPYKLKNYFENIKYQVTDNKPPVDMGLTATLGFGSIGGMHVDSNRQYK